MHLLIDNSNTRTKFALDHGEGLSEWRGVVPTSELSPESLREVLEGQEFTHVTVCSVVPQTADLFTQFFEAPIHQVSHRSELTIEIDYPRPEQIGADRLANAVAAYQSYQGPVIVIDFGTAVTFDVVSNTGSYLGGVIAPGTASLRDYLHKKTALLPSIQLEEPSSAIGKSTEDAMQVGAVIGYRGLVEGILQAVSAELAGEPTVVATGGDAALMKAGLDSIQHLDPDLTMRGICAIGRANHRFFD